MNYVNIIGGLQFVVVRLSDFALLGLRDFKIRLSDFMSKQ